MNKRYTNSTFLLFVFLSTLLSAAFAMELSGLDRNVSITVREQPVQKFLETLFSQVNVPVVISEDIQGLMNGRFDGSAREVFADVSMAFNITLYFDGVVAHVYSASEISRTLMPMPAGIAREVEKIASHMKLGDRYNSVDGNSGGGLMVTGTPRYFEQIEELYYSVQSTTEKSAMAPMAYRVFYLSYAWAADTNFSIGDQSVTLSGVATLLGNLVAGARLPEPAGEQSSIPGNTGLEGLRGRGMQSVNNGESSIVEPGVSTALVLPSGTGARIVADSRLNAVIIRDTSDRMPAYQALINDLDRPSQMVEIEATIIDVNTDKTRELGLGWQYRHTDGEASLVGGAGQGAGVVVPGVPVQGPGAILSMALGGRRQFLSRIRALEEKGAARVVSKPHIITLSDVEAVLGATTEFFVRVAGDQEVDLFNVPVGTTMRVTPHVFQESGQTRIKLLVNIEDGTTSSRQVDRIPVIERANINTQAVINEGDSLLIGGLVRESDKQVTNSVPVLGSIPLVGRLFKSSSRQSSRVERLFMITPRTAQGLGFGQVHTGQRKLPVLQGHPVDIEAQASERMSYGLRSVERRTSEIPMPTMQLGRRAASMATSVVSPASLSVSAFPGNDHEAALQQWIAIPGFKAHRQNSREDEGHPVDRKQWRKVPVPDPQAGAISPFAPVVDQKGWTVIQ